MNSITTPDILGSLGAAIIVATYMLLQMDRVRSDQIWYSILNFIGASLILFSLYFKFNLSAFLIEIFWVFISLYGIWKKRREISQS
ncbi:hypothetical protein Q4544_15005 [Cognatishimia sp. 1_MG-2023]|uniref:CBU_0592 family membrane protein n=1 Tax=Cognatishimia sp. 1_MG-2023 TaxID=3062642 RepID=UPI0026E28C82|nr:hypothetical protein [Cognatishimia sp. 1_MG-2023]MDO6728247.1 hypothetical protein [Cognatishimia sp. 1_MG-2023]